MTARRLRRYRLRPVVAARAVEVVAARVPEGYEHAPQVWRNAALCALCLYRWGRLAFADADAVVARLTLEEIAEVVRAYTQAVDGGDGFVRNESFDAQLAQLQREVTAHGVRAGDPAQRAGV